MSATPLPGPRPSHDQQARTGPGPAPASSWWAQFSGAQRWLGRRINDVKMAPSWSLTATWIKAAAVIGGAAIGYLTLRWIAALLIGWVHALPWPLPVADDHTGLLATIDHPVRHYLATHTASLPVNATTVYGTWQAVGVVSFILAYLRSTGARLTWTVWGAATVAMVWIGTDESGRQVAAGIAILAWAALSVLALRGLALTPAAFVHVDVHNAAPQLPEVRAEIHLSKPPEPSSYKPYDPTKQPPSLN